MKKDLNDQHSRIEKSTSIVGNIKAETDIRVDGKLEGEVETKGKLIIGKDARVDGKVKCSSADIEGAFKGNIAVREILSLRTGCNIEGEVSVGKLVVESGAVFNAVCSMNSNEEGVKSISKFSKKHGKTA